MSTTDEVLIEKQEELIERIRTLTDQVEALKQSLETKFVTRTELETVRAEFATREEVKTIGAEIGTAIQTPLQTRIDKHLKELSGEDAKRHNEFNTRIGETHALVIQNEQRIITAEATTDGRFQALERRVDHIETVQQNQVKTVEDIKTNSDTTAQNAVAMRSTFDEFLKRYEKQTTETAFDVEVLKAAQAQDVKEIRLLQTEVNRQDRALNEQRTFITEWSVPVQLLIVGDKDKKIPGMNERLVVIEEGVKAALWFVRTPVGRGVLAAGVTALVGSNLAVLAALTQAGK